MSPHEADPRSVEEGQSSSGDDMAMRAGDVSGEVGAPCDRAYGAGCMALQEAATVGPEGAERAAKLKGPPCNVLGQAVWGSGRHEDEGGGVAVAMRSDGVGGTCDIGSGKSGRSVWGPTKWAGERQSGVGWRRWLFLLLGFVGAMHAMPGRDRLRAAARANGQGGAPEGVGQAAGMLRDDERATGSSTGAAQESSGSWASLQASRVGPRRRRSRRGRPSKRRRTREARSRGAVRLGSGAVGACQARDADRVDASQSDGEAVADSVHEVGRSGNAQDSSVDFDAEAGDALVDHRGKLRVHLTHQAEGWCPRKSEASALPGVASQSEAQESSVCKACLASRDCASDSAGGGDGGGRRAALVPGERDLVCSVCEARAGGARPGASLSLEAMGGVSALTWDAAAKLVQRRWRRHWLGRGPQTALEQGWTGAWLRQHGPIVGHVKFLQWFFRASVTLQEGCWRRGKLRVPAMVALRVGRGWKRPRCSWGANLASEADFQKQRELADRMLDWYAHYVTLLRRLESGVTPTALQNFCGGGGSTEGCRRAGGAAHGIDLYDQPDYKRRFGGESFTCADGMSWSQVTALRVKHRARFMIGGPPCKFYSRARVRGAAKQPPLIDGFRDQCKALFGRDGYWAIENVMGARRYMAADAAVLDGAYFGLRVARERLYETNFGVHVDASVREAADGLAARCCLGRRRRFRRHDEFGRPVISPCCGGNIFAVQGTAPWRCTHSECAAAMGVDAGHMSYERLAQSVPPAYGQLVFSQMCMRMCGERHGVPMITFDAMLANPGRSQRELAFWLRGAGATEQELGQLFLPAPEMAAEPAGTARAEQHRAEGCEREAEFRELFYSHAGGFDQQWVTADVSGRLGRVARGRTLEAEPTVQELVGHNTYVEGVGGVERLAGAVCEAIELGGSGTRATFVVHASQREMLESLGFEYLACCVGGKGPDALAYKGLVAMCVGRRAGVRREHRLDHAAVLGHMDWRDQGGWSADPIAKAHLTWEYYPHDPERYRGVGLPPWVESMMVEGARIEMDRVLPKEDVEQYTWPSGKSLVEAIMETERHLAIGALEFVPAAEVEDVLANHVVHPLLLVDQGKGKYRACHDYSRGTNRGARSAPFGLPAVWDARDVIKPGSYFCKYDLRDGFFAVPVHPDSRNRLVLRHPATGRLLRCARLPFGYIDSPRLFCGLTEAVADLVRRRCVGRGVHVFVFVDDFLIVGDDREAAVFGGEVLEQVLDELGIAWAPHKQRGPTQCIDFLGLLLCNVEGHRCIALTESRQAKLAEQLEVWSGRRPVRGAPAVRADVNELAAFLGHLVFCSQVVPQGRTYMQAMLAQFAGLEVDWRRGAVRPTGQAKQWMCGVELAAGFWRDLDWWQERLQRRNCTPMERPPRGEVALCGTDASDWGTGQLLWDDGQRAEVVQRFTLAERARSINWRELLGIVRVVEQFGEQLRGRALLVEGDNTSALSAAANEHSKAEDSQELVRRLVELVEEYELQVRFTHTPGVKLDRPDQTSRGDPIEEPRVRLTRGAYDLLERRWGPFNEWIGAERRYASGRRLDPSGARIWMHPAHATVGSALRRLGERLGDRDGAGASGLVIVPHDERAKWWQLTRHFRVVGRWEVGSDHLESSRVAGWVGVRAQRASLILAFPRSSGGVTRPLRWRAGEEKAGYSVLADDFKSRHLFLPMPVGSFFYVPCMTEADEPGELFMTWEGFDPGAEGSVTFDGRQPLVWGAEMLRSRKQGKSSGPVHYELDARCGLGAGGKALGSFAAAGQTPWAWAAKEAYDVTHLVSYVKGCGDNVRTSGAGRVQWQSVRQVKILFDVLAAEREIGDSAQRAMDARTSPSPSASPASEASDASSASEKGSNEDMAADLAAADGGPGAEEALRAAKRSAEEAAAARVKVVAACQALGAKKVEKLAVPTSKAVQPCKYAEMLCEGCGGKIGWGNPMMAGGRGMVHANDECAKLAADKLAEAVKAGEAVPAAEVAGGRGSLKKQVQLDHRVSASRVDMVLKCLDGKCGVVGEKLMMCVEGCGRGVHGKACCMFSSGVIALGNLQCAYCRAGKLVVSSCTPTEGLVRRAVEPMIVEATTGASATHKGYCDLAMLERKWQEGVGEASGLRASVIMLPHTSAEGTYHFVLWLATSGPRARSLGTTVRQLGAFCTKLEMPDYTKSGRLKALLKELEVKGAAWTTPCTQVTSLMIKEMYGPEGTIAAVCSKRKETAELMTARETVLNDLELVGGMRVAEVTGALHGLLANNVIIQEAIGSGSEYGETIEATLEDSKTYMGRYTVFAGTTKSTQVRTAQHMRKLWRVSGLTVKHVTTGGFVMERPDYWVVRVSLLDMDEHTYKRFYREVENTGNLVMIAHRKATLKYAKANRTAETLGDEARYVNVAGGEQFGREVAEASSWLQSKGFGNYFQVVEGPLIRATFGYKLSHMPYSPKSTHVHLIPAMEMAFERVQQSAQSDPEHDNVSDPTPKFGNHSNRRHADRVATRNKGETQVTEDEINLFFGWKLKEMDADMLRHYAGLDRLQRLKLSKVTCMI